MCPDEEKITARIIKLTTVDGFIQEFWKMAQHCRTYNEAYEALENEYMGYFKRRRYASYDSFRTVRDRKNKN